MVTQDELDARVAALEAANKAEEDNAAQSRITALEKGNKRDVFQEGRRAGGLEQADLMQSGSQWSKAGTAISDMLSAGIHGATFGFDDKLTAGLHTAAGNIGSSLGISEDVNYDKALEEEQYNTARRQGRMDVVMPHSSDVFEGLGSLAMPGGFVKSGVAKALPFVTKAYAPVRAVGRGVADILENAGYGMVSAFGHNQDPKTGAAVGGAGVATPAVAATAATTMPTVLKGLGIGGGAELGSQWLDPVGSYFGGKYGGQIMQGIGTLGADALRSPFGRAGLAMLMRAPGRLYGQVAENKDVR